MQHSIQTHRFGVLGPSMADVVQKCVHCGFCLAACPTYRETGREIDSPRGRIVLMKENLEGTLSSADAQPAVDRCLGCLACEPACPSGVPYRDLLSAYRATAQRSRRDSTGDRLQRWLTARTLPHPTRFRLAARLGGLGRHLGAAVPGPVRRMLDLLPSAIPEAVSLVGRHPAVGERRASVALLAGCVQQVLDPDINAATIDVLTRNGIEVLVPANQGCCGGLAWHTGDLAAARKFARRNLAAFPVSIDAIVTNAAGCGSTMHEYPLILRGTPDEARAKALCRRVVDVSVFLHRFGLRAMPGGQPPIKVAYHDACHLAHAQDVRAQPRALLRTIPGLELLELADGHGCCGSAGTYNLDQPEIAGALGRQKAQAVIATGTSVVVSGNIGCLVQLQAHLAKLGSPIRVRHTMQILRDAYSTCGGPEAAQ